ncbi:hypothetical protein [Marilutibacter maris]|uniref:VCBS repeat-containing protein n=1 Tax=Marilutibacter maris TaxID=1605891 RepID=A0A2U9T814_9GAMM|nr:hypothetical protein [Lysobacter maris]AWV07505.1 hypothetical protein C9I47_1816 [Lysobacter maris]
MRYPILATVVAAILAGCSAPQSETGQAASADGERSAMEAATETAAPERTAAGDAADASPQAQGFAQHYELQGIAFDVRAGGGTLTVTPRGLEASNEAMVTEIEGTVSAAEVADVNADGSPEIYVFVQPPGGKATARLVAYSTNNLKSMSEIYLAPLSEDAENGPAFGGGNEFAVIENFIGQRFPVIGDDGKPTGKTRQLLYRLEPGEAGWVLVLDQVQEY